ncbi:hypothetical protein QC762_107070 [Podospora pseudocomata]|uniref:Secreted protein n=1 Tax=Podospora pseudocomata TaxID=2093779 RepID=A0ABR0GTH1_9PEZI|nr:hypothetical protein QC762_107070 [Podospora pseudocomata]
MLPVWSPRPSLYLVSSYVLLFTELKKRKDRTVESTPNVLGLFSRLFCSTLLNAEFCCHYANGCGRFKHISQSNNPTRVPSCDTANGCGQRKIFEAFCVTNRWFSVRGTSSSNLAQEKPFE